MRHEHREIQERILERFEGKFHVSIENRGRISLPDKDRHWYQPDVILSSHEIEYIIEVECDPMRKVIVGACVLADASIKELHQQVKPKLIFVVYTEQGIKQIGNFKDKIDIAKPYCQALGEIKVVSRADFEKLQL